MNELDDLLDELKTNNNLYKQLTSFIKELENLKSFCAGNDTKVKIVFAPGVDSLFISSLFECQKYSLFLADKIISLTEINGKAIYSRKDIFDLAS